MQVSPLSNNYLASPASPSDDEEAPPEAVTTLGGGGDYFPRGPDPQADLAELRILAFQRVESQDANTYMGTAWRSAIMGDVHLACQEGWPHFDLVDLWTRKDFKGNERQFLNEEHLFLPVPMAYRTWIYHDLYLQRKVLLGKDREHAMVTAALNARCIDVANVSAGRWSPIMCYGPIVLLTCLTGDMFTVMPGIATILVQYVLSLAMNKPQYYRYLRLALLPIRLVFLIVMVFRLQATNILALVGFSAAIALMVVDVLLGDLQTLMWYRLNCSYEIIKILPNRVFICRRHGASHQEDVFGTRGRVAESISGLGAWSRSFYIIADINGILAELRPVSEETWKSIYNEQRGSRELTFLGRDVFSEDYPAVGAFGVRYKERQAVIEKFKRDLPSHNLLNFDGQREADAWAEFSSPRAEPTGLQQRVPGSVEETDF